MNIAELLSEDQQAQDYPLLRREAGRLLKPGPWDHACLAWHYIDGELTGAISACSKCGIVPFEREGCSIPDPAEGPLEVVAEQLLRWAAHREGMFCHSLHSKLEYVYRQIHPVDEMCYGFHVWWIFEATPAERIACCLLALEGED